MGIASKTFRNIAFAGAVVAGTSGCASLEVVSASPTEEDYYRTGQYMHNRAFFGYSYNYLGRPFTGQFNRNSGYFLQDHACHDTGRHYHRHYNNQYHGHDHHNDYPYNYRGYNRPHIDVYYDGAHGSYYLRNDIVGSVILGGVAVGITNRILDNRRPGPDMSTSGMKPE